MPSSRRVTAVIMLLLLLQSMGLGSGALGATDGVADCEATMAHTGSRTSDTGDMSGMQMPDAPQSPDDHESDGPCGLPWAFGCTSAAACLPLVVPMAVANVAGRALAQAHISAAYATRPESLARAPELPPPRA